MIKKICLSLFLLLLLISSHLLVAPDPFGTGTAIHAIERINLPNYTGFVNDFAGAIESPYKEKLENLCIELEKKTSAELAIATVKTVSPLDSKMYAVKLFEKWKIGKRGKDNGILILLAMDERRVEIEVGYGLEGIITDGTAGEILDKYVIPRFKEGKFGEGLYNGAEAIANLIAKASDQELGKEYQGYKKGYTDIDKLIMPIAIIAIILLMFLSIFAYGLASGLIGAIIGGVFGYFIAGIIGAALGALIGFMLSYTRLPGTGRFGSWGQGFGGGFSGFGGGRSGGGGAGRSW